MKKFIRKLIASILLPLMAFPQQTVITERDSTGYTVERRATDGTVRHTTYVQTEPMVIIAYEPTPPPSNGSGNGGGNGSGNGNGGGGTGSGSTGNGNGGGGSMSSTVYTNPGRSWTFVTPQNPVFTTAPSPPDARFAADVYVGHPAERFNQAIAQIAQSKASLNAVEKSLADFRIKNLEVLKKQSENISAIRPTVKSFHNPNFGTPEKFEAAAHEMFELAALGNRFTLAQKLSNPELADDLKSMSRNYFSDSKGILTGLPFVSNRTYQLSNNPNTYSVAMINRSLSLDSEIIERCVDPEACKEFQQRTGETVVAALMMDRAGSTLSLSQQRQIGIAGIQQTEEVARDFGIQKTQLRQEQVSRITSDLSTFSRDIIEQEPGLRSSLDRRVKDALPEGISDDEIKTLTETTYRNLVANQMIAQYCQENPGACQTLLDGSRRAVQSSATSAVIGATDADAAKLYDLLREKRPEFSLAANNSGQWTPADFDQLETLVHKLETFPAKDPQELRTAGLAISALKNAGLLDQLGQDGKTLRFFADRIMESIDGAIVPMTRIGIGLIPFVGDATDIYECLVGKDALSGAELSVSDRALALTGVLIGSRLVNKAATKWITQAVESKVLTEAVAFIRQSTHFDNGVRFIKSMPEEFRAISKVAADLRGKLVEDFGRFIGSDVGGKLADDLSRFVKSENRGLSGLKALQRDEKIAAHFFKEGPDALAAIKKGESVSVYMGIRGEGNLKEIIENGIANPSATRFYQTNPGRMGIGRSAAYDLQTLKAEMAEYDSLEKFTIIKAEYKPPSMEDFVIAPSARNAEGGIVFHHTNMNTLDASMPKELIEVLGPADKVLK